MSSRELILGRIRTALGDQAVSPGESAPAISRTYLHEHGRRTPEELVDLLAENLADYRAIVHRADLADVPALIAELLPASQRVAAPPDLPASYLAASSATMVSDSLADLDRADAVITACALAIAETGTIVLDAGPGQGRRRSTLIPDRHICVVRVPDQVVSSVPEALALLDPSRPLTWISGPSATSDIELDRVEGVHGPRRLDVILALT